MQSAMTRTLSTKAITLMSTYSPAADERIYSYDIYSREPLKTITKNKKNHPKQVTFIIEA